MSTESIRKEPRPAAAGPRPRRRATDVDVLVGLRLRDARQFAGLSQQQLGRAMGISFQAVQKYENGENRLAVGRLARAAKLLEQPVSFFFSEPNGSPSAVSPVLSAQEADLVRHYRNIGDDHIRSHLLRLIRELDESQPRGGK